MKLIGWLRKWKLNNLKIKSKYLEAEWKPLDPDRKAAWELYIEMLTRIATQPLPDNFGDEKTALESIYSLFAVTRDILKTQGRHCVQFTKIAVIVLNQIVRPFTAKWHKLSNEKAFGDPKKCEEFRRDLASLQVLLRNYTSALADIAQVEDLTDLGNDTNENSQ